MAPVTTWKVLWLVLGNFVSKGVGLFREVLFAAWFGAGDTAAGFRIAQTSFILPIHGVVGDTLSAGLLPLYRKIKEDNEDHARVLVLTASLYGLIFSGALTSLLFFGAHLAARIVAPGASPEVLVIAERLLKVMALATPFYVLSGLLSYLEAAYGKFGAIAWRPLILNIGAIAGAGLAVYFNQDHWLATTLLLSHIGFFCKTLFSLRKLDRITPASHHSLEIINSVARRFFRNILPLMGLPLISQANMLVERIVSSWLGTVVIPSVDYARALADTGVQLLAVPVGILTMAAHGGESGETARAFARTAVSALIVLAFPTAIFLSLNAEDIVRLLYARGEFGAEAIEATSTILTWMGAGVAFAVPAFYLIKVFNAQLRNKDALAITAAGALINMTVNLVGWRYLGPAVIGIAVMAQGLVMLLLSLVRLGLAKELSTLILWMVGGCLAQVAIHQMTPHSSQAWLRLVYAVVAALLPWLLIVQLSPPIRVALQPLLLRVAAWPRNKFQRRDLE